MEVAEKKKKNIFEKIANNRRTQEMKGCFWKAR